MEGVARLAPSQDRRSRSPKRDAVSSNRRFFARRGKVKQQESQQWPGCHIAHRHAAWILGVDELDEDPFAHTLANSDDLPDISIDPEQRVLSVINSTHRDRCYYLSLPGECGCCDVRGRPLNTGFARDADGSKRAVIAFVLLVGARQVMDVCELSGCVDVEDIDIHSDVLDFVRTQQLPVADAAKGRVYSFPLGGSGSYLCSQGHGGRLTHFAHPSTFYAVDLDCEVGTAVLAINDGVVEEVKDSEDVSGIDIKNFFQWNQVTIRQEDGTLAEYVHITKGSASARIQKGDRVRRGQIICLSGDVGFCPTPHLHLEVHLESELSAPSVPFFFEGTRGPFKCEEGQRYDKDGPVTGRTEHGKLCR